MIESLLEFNLDARSSSDYGVSYMAYQSRTHVRDWPLPPAPAYPGATGVRHDTEGEPIAWPDGSVFGCLWCLSCWVGLLVLFLPTIVLLPFALSCVAILIELTTDWLRARRL